MASCLIVDDSRVVRAVARRILEDLDLEVLEAENGEVALAHCRQQMPDSILLDWNMPVMDGMGFLKSICAEHGDQRPVIVFCTTERSMDHIQRALDAGADEYIMKPFDQEIVQSKFQEVGVIRPAKVA